MTPRNNILFLDIDGVINCQLLYASRTWDERALLTYEQDNLCPDRIKWVSELCKDANAVVVLSSTWRYGRTVQELQDMFDRMGAYFTIVGVTPILNFSSLALDGQERPDSYASTPRGSEIKHFLDHTQIDWLNYAIIDDDGDMLLGQAAHFFQTDPYAGLTPYTCKRVHDYLTAHTLKNEIK